MSKVWLPGEQVTINRLSGEQVVNGLTARFKRRVGRWVPVLSIVSVQILAFGSSGESFFFSFLFGGWLDPFMGVCKGFQKSTTEKGEKQVRRSRSSLDEF